MHRLKCSILVSSVLVLCFVALPPLASHEFSLVIMSFLRKLSERCVRVFSQHDDETKFMGTPVCFTGA